MAQSRMLHLVAFVSACICIRAGMKRASRMKLREISALRSYVGQGEKGGGGGGSEGGGTLNIALCDFSSRQSHINFPPLSANRDLWIALSII